MATYVWTGTTSGTWSTGTNWTPTGPPTTGDTAVIDGRSLRAITGSDESAVTLANLFIYASVPNAYSIGTAALPLKIGATNCEIDLPAADGSSPTGAALIALDLAAIASAVTTYGGPNTGTSGQEPRLIAGTNAANVLYVKGGVVGVGTMTPGQASTFATVIATGGTVNIGTNATLTTVTNKGATFNSASTIPTLNNYAGTTTLTELAKITTTLNNYGGTLIPNGRPASGATIGTCNQRGGTLDLSRDLRAITITTLSDGGGSIQTGTNGASQVTVTTTTLYYGDNSSRSTQVSK